MKKLEESDYLYFIENVLGVNLLESQKIFLSNLMQERDIYCLPIRNLDGLMMLAAVYKVILARQIKSQN